MTYWTSLSESKLQLSDGDDDADDDMAKNTRGSFTLGF